jgi:hypothetical protein
MAEQPVSLKLVRTLDLTVGHVAAAIDAYDDAPCAGSVVGVIAGRPGDDLRLGPVFPLDPKIKAEGLALEPRRVGAEDRVDFYVVTDDDDPTRASRLFVATLRADDLARVPAAVTPTSPRPR